MSDTDKIQRYRAILTYDTEAELHIPAMRLDEAGEWVDYSDHAAIVAAKDARIAELDRELSFALQCQIPDAEHIGHERGYQLACDHKMREIQNRDEEIAAKDAEIARLNKRLMEYSKMLSDERDRVCGHVLGQVEALSCNGFTTLRSSMGWGNTSWEVKVQDYENPYRYVRSRGTSSIEQAVLDAVEKIERGEWVEEPKFHLPTAVAAARREAIKEMIGHLEVLLVQKKERVNYYEERSLRPPGGTVAKVEALTEAVEKLRALIDAAPSTGKESADA